MPTSSCPAMAAWTAASIARSSWAASTASPRSCRTRSSRSAGFRGRLPTWEVRMRWSLVCTRSGAPPRGEPQRDLWERDDEGGADQQEDEEGEAAADHLAQRGSRHPLECEEVEARP